jgi:hypothetical protein
LIGLLVLMVLQRVPAQETTPQPASKEAGRVDIQGEFIQKLTVESKGGRVYEFQKPASSLQLPADEYRVSEVVLEGGYCWLGYSDWFAVAPGKPHVLEVGAPLIPRVSARRFGRLVTINYDLVGAGGRSYTCVDRNRASRPRFVVRKDNQEIASGSFEYG